MRQLILILHNVRSCHNVGAMLRTSEGLGIDEVIMTGYTPFPMANDDPRLPHLAAKIDRQIAKTSLGAEKSVKWRHAEEIMPVLEELKASDFTVAALEQAEDSIKLPDYQPPDKLALIVGREVEGLEPEVIRLCDLTLEIPMFGQKESFNVASAAAMALFHCRFVLDKRS